MASTIAEIRRQSSLTMDIRHAIDPENNAKEENEQLPTCEHLFGTSPSTSSSSSGSYLDSNNNLPEHDEDSVDKKKDKDSEMYFDPCTDASWNLCVVPSGKESNACTPQTKSSDIDQQQQQNDDDDDDQVRQCNILELQLLRQENWMLIQQVQSLHEQYDRHVCSFNDQLHQERMQYHQSEQKLQDQLLQLQQLFKDSQAKEKRAQTQLKIVQERLAQLEASRESPRHYYPSISPPLAPPPSYYQITPLSPVPTASFNQKTPLSPSPPPMISPSRVCPPTKWQQPASISKNAPANPFQWREDAPANMLPLPLAYQPPPTPAKSSATGLSTPSPSTSTGYFGNFRSNQSSYLPTVASTSSIPITQESDSSINAPPATFTRTALVKKFSGGLMALCSDFLSSSLSPSSVSPAVAATSSKVLPSSWKLFNTANTSDLPQHERDQELGQQKHSVPRTSTANSNWDIYETTTPVVPTQSQCSY